jgi:hypothetical protein
MIYLKHKTMGLGPQALNALCFNDPDIFARPEGTVQ